MKEMDNANKVFIFPRLESCNRSPARLEVLIRAAEVMLSEPAYAAPDIVSMEFPSGDST